jgi:hypothetical protein
MDIIRKIKTNKENIERNLMQDLLYDNLIDYLIEENLILDVADGYYDEPKQTVWFRGRDVPTKVLLVSNTVELSEHPILDVLENTFKIEWENRDWILCLKDNLLYPVNKVKIEEGEVICD